MQLAPTYDMTTGDTAEFLAVDPSPVDGGQSDMDIDSGNVNPPSAQNLENQNDIIQMAPTQQMPMPDSRRQEWWQHLGLLEDVDVKAILCQRFKPVRNIPKRCLSAFCDVMDSTLQGIVHADAAVARRCSRLWLLLPRMILSAVFGDRPQVVARGGDLRRMIRDKLRRFHGGEWLELLHEAHSQQHAAPANARAPDFEEAGEEDEAEEEFQRVAREVIRLCRLNELSRAMARLTSSGIAPPSREVAEMLRREITGGHAPADVAPGIGFDWRAADLPKVRIDADALRKRLREAPRGSSPSASGWRFEFLKLTLRSQQSFQGLVDVSAALANAEAPADLVEGLRLNPLTAKRKGPDRVRPLAAPDALRRLVAGTLCSSKKGEFLQDLSPEQHAVGLPAGAEVLAKSAQAHAERTGFAVVKVDGTSAFNRQIRRVAFAELAACRPELVRFAAQFYDGRSCNLTWDEKGAPIIIEADEGWDQGDPFAPVGFSYGLRTALRQARAAIAAMVLHETQDAAAASAVRV